MSELCDVVVIKIYSDGKNKLMCGKRRNGELLAVDTIKRILKENRVKNVGEFIVISRARRNGVFITEFSNGVKIGRGAVVWMNDTRVLIDALEKLMVLGDGKEVGKK